MLFKIQQKSENFIHRWWFYLIIVLIQIIPPLSTHNWSLAEWIKIDQAASSHAWVYSAAAQSLYTLFKLIPLGLLCCLVLFKNKFNRTFSIYAGISYLLFFGVQLIGFNHPHYGTVFNTPGFIMFFMVTLAWLMEAVVNRNDYSEINLSLKKIWVIPLAIFAFWLPEKNGLPHFDPLMLITSAGGMAMCMMTPFYIALLTLIYPRVNMVTLRITSIVGFVIGFYQMLFTFGFNFQNAWWGGVMHLPLIILSIYGIILTNKKRTETASVER